MQDAVTRQSATEPPILGEPALQRPVRQYPVPRSVTMQRVS